METTATQIASLNPLSILAHVRKNHAMEHATITILSKSLPRTALAGVSIPRGYFIFGEAELDAVEKAAEMAYARLSNGEKSLAIHPNCGTNIAMIGLCSAAASMAVLALEDEEEYSPFNRFSSLVTAGMIGVLAGKPLGPKVQKKVTTDPDVKNLHIQGIRCGDFHGKKYFFVETALNQ